MRRKASEARRRPILDLPAEACPFRKNLLSPPQSFFMKLLYLDH
jgi:hypothetical protein